MKSPAVATPALPRFVELVRVSTQGQADRETPQAQRADLARLRSERPGIFVEVIEYVGSGAKDLAERLDLQRLSELADARAFDEVRVRHFDRLTRSNDPDEQEAMLSIIRRARASIVEANGTVIDPRSTVGRITSILKAEGAAEERQKIVERTQGRKALRAKEHRLAQGSPPYGRTFDKTTGDWGLDPKTAPIYRRLFDECIAGRSLLQIADTLDKEGCVTRHGRRWTDVAVSRLMRLRSAFGEYTTHGVTFQIPAIVDEATFRAAEAKRRENNSLSGPKPVVFALLRKLATCGVCGSTLYLQLGAGGAYRYYYCSSRDPKCMAYHRVSDLDPAVLDALRSALDDPGKLERAAGLDAPEDTRKVARRELAEAEHTLGRLDEKEVNLGRLLLEGISPATQRKLLGEIQAQRAAATAKRSAAQATLAAADRSADAKRDLRATVEAMRQGLANASPAKWRALCEIVFQKGGIQVHPNGRIELRGRMTLAATRTSPPAFRGTR